MSAPIVDRKKWIVGWSILGLSAFVAVLLYVRDTREGMWGCLIPISFGLILLLESRKKEEAPLRPKKIRPGQWLVIVACLTIGSVVSYLLFREP